MERRRQPPALQHMGEAGFVEDGTPENEWPTVFDAVIEAAEAQAVTAPPAERRPGIDPRGCGELLIAHRGVVMSKAGTCPEGHIVRRDDPLALAVPEALAPLIEQLLG